jgi:hypothetical protein
MLSPGRGGGAKTARRLFLGMIELNDFYNEGFGWVCRHCERRSATEGHAGSSRLMSEGEAESKQPSLSTVALARWLDRLHTTLICPGCGITERVERS